MNNKYYQYIYGGDKDAERFFDEVEMAINKFLERNVEFKIETATNNYKHLFAKVSDKEYESINNSGIIGWIVFGYEI